MRDTGPAKTQSERLHIAGWDRKQAAAAAGAARTAAKAAELTASQKTAIIDKKVQPGEKPDVHTVGHIDRELYKCMTDDIQTDEVIITDERIGHIESHHPGEYEKVYQYLEGVLKDPDYIMADSKSPEDTGLLLKRFMEDNERVQVVLRLLTSKDRKGYKNSILSAWTISESRWRNYEKNKKILYRRDKK